METEQRAIVIAGFAGVGKSTLARQAKYIQSRPVVELQKDSFLFGDDGTRNSNPSRGYVGTIMKRLSEPCILLVQAHVDVREALVDRGVDFYFVYPGRECRGDYCERYLRKGEADMARVYHTFWETFIGTCERQDGCHHRRLEPRQYLDTAYVESLLRDRVSDR